MIAFTGINTEGINGYRFATDDMKAISDFIRLFDLQCRIYKDDEAPNGKYIDVKIEYDAWKQAKNFVVQSKMN